MTRMYEDLEDFHKQLFKRNKYLQVTEKDFNIKCGKAFGTSKFIRRSIIEELVDFGFIRAGETPGTFKNMHYEVDETEEEEKILQSARGSNE